MKMTRCKLFCGIFFAILFCIANAYSDTLDDVFANMDRQLKKDLNAPFLSVGRIDTAISKGDYNSAIEQIFRLIRRDDVPLDTKVLLYMQGGMIYWNINACQESKTCFHEATFLYQHITGYNVELLKALQTIEQLIQTRSPNWKFENKDMLQDGNNSFLYQFKKMMHGRFPIANDSISEQSDSQGQSNEQNNGGKKSNWLVGKIRAEMAVTASKNALKKQQREAEKQKRINKQRSRLSNLGW